MMGTQQHRYRLHPQAAHRKVAGELFVVTADRSFHRVQASTAVELFDALAQNDGATRDELVSLLTHGYDVTRATAEADVAAFLDTLLARQLAVAVDASTRDVPADSPKKVTP